MMQIGDLFRQVSLLPRTMACTIAVSCFVGSFACAQLKIDGVYNGSNITISTGDEHCITAIFVNKVPQTQIVGTAVEIDLKDRFAIGDSMHIVVHHVPGCRPKMLHANPVTIPTRRIDSSYISPEGAIAWKTLNRRQTTYYVIQQYRWNRWDSVGVVLPETTKETYTFQPASLHSGDNVFRIAAWQKEQAQEVGEELHITSDKDPIAMRFYKKERYIVFSTPVFFRFYNEAGELLLEGEEQSFLINSYPKGIYFVLFDNQTEKIRL